MAGAWGGVANSLSYDLENASGKVEDSLNSLIGGYGFAVFVCIVAFILFITAAIIYSPLLKGSENEKKQLRGPHEVDSGNY